MSGDSSLSISIETFHWKPVFTIPQGTVLEKGRRGIYHDITSAAGSISFRFGCYCWRTSEEVYYIGSFSRDYVRGGFKSNLQGRVHNYLQNHRLKKTGHKNTNLIVFENINQTLISSEVLLAHFRFGVIKVEDEVLTLEDYSSVPDLVRTVEQWLLYRYRTRGECKWNRV